MKDRYQRKNMDRIEAAVRALVSTDGLTVQCVPDYVERQITCTIEGPFALRYEYMPRFAEIFQTEHLDFGQTEAIDEYRHSSWTWDPGESAKFRIRARYDD